MTTDDVLGLYNELHVPLHIRRHMVMVCAVGSVLAQALAEKGEAVDIESLQFAALLHDALKIIAIKDYQEAATAEDLQVWAELKKQYHGLTDSAAMQHLLTARNEAKIGQIISKHDFSSLVKDDMQPYNLEEKLLYYADKRVQHDQVVDLAARLQDGRERYITTEQQLQKSLQIEEHVFQLEDVLFTNLSFTPQDLKALSKPLFLQLSMQYLR